MFNQSDFFNHSNGINGSGSNSSAYNNGNNNVHGNNSIGGGGGGNNGGDPNQATRETGIIEKLLVCSILSFIVVLLCVFFCLFKLFALTRSQ